MTARTEVTVTCRAFGVVSVSFISFTELEEIFLNAENSWSNRGVIHDGQYFVATVENGTKRLQRIKKVFPSETASPANLADKSDNCDRSTADSLLEAAEDSFRKSEENKGRRKDRESANTVHQSTVRCLSRAGGE